MSKSAARLRCCYCGNQLYNHAERPGVEPGNLLTRDHIVPRAWRQPLPADVRTTRRCCHACDQLRAQLDHCPAMLHFARDLAQAWRLPSRREAARAMFCAAAPATRAGVGLRAKSLRTWSAHAMLHLHADATEAERLRIAQIALAGTAWRIAPATEAPR